MANKLTASPLGKQVEIPDGFTSSILFPIPRHDNRRAFDLDPLPFQGEDYWTAYEISWLDPNGKPLNRIAEVRIPCHSPQLIESKSLKLYFNALNLTQWAHEQDVIDCIMSDLTQAVGAPISLDFYTTSEFSKRGVQPFHGISIDTEPVDIHSYTPDPKITSALSATGSTVNETLFSELFRSSCPVTGQPDWADISIQYTGPQINRAALLRYLVSYRQHSGFHEHVVELIFVDLWKYCRPEHLTVYARFTRRGGIDINPFRSTLPSPFHKTRHVRQ